MRKTASSIKRGTSPISLAGRTGDPLKPAPKSGDQRKDRKERNRGRTCGHTRSMIAGLRWPRVGFAPQRWRTSKRKLRLPWEPERQGLLGTLGFGGWGSLEGLGFFVLFFQGGRVNSCSSTCASIANYKAWPGAPCDSYSKTPRPKTPSYYSYPLGFLVAVIR